MQDLIKYPICLNTISVSNQTVTKYDLSTMTSYLACRGRYAVTSDSYKTINFIPQKYSFFVEHFCRTFLYITLLFLTTTVKNTCNTLLLNIRQQQNIHIQRAVDYISNPYSEILCSALQCYKTYLFSSTNLIYRKINVFTFHTFNVL